MIEDEKTGVLFVDPSMVEMIPIGELKLYEKNAKKHTAEQIEQIKTSIEKFGMNDPIGVWGDDNVIVEGHGRYLALRSLGFSGDVPCIHLDHLDDTQRRAYALAHNQLTMSTDFNDFLLPELEALSDVYDMSAFGFSLPDLDESGSVAITEDEAPEVDEVEPCCKRGQIWVLGCHRLMCGDSTNRSDVEKLRGGGKS